MSTAEQELCPLCNQEIQIWSSEASFYETLVYIEPLTNRERTVMRYLRTVLTTREIAAALSVSINTVKTHQQNIYRKLGASGRRDAVRRGKGQ